MKLCLVANEFFAWGKYGGYGSTARVLAIELAGRGLQVEVVTPRRGEQAAEEKVDGVVVSSFSPTSVAEQLAAYRRSDADLYHCLEPSLSAYLARRAMPGRRHVVTCRYVRDAAALRHETWTYLEERRFKAIASLLYAQNPLIGRAIRCADAVACVARFEGMRARQRYRLERDPEYLPTPIRAVKSTSRKADRPTVCFVGRWERRKYPELFFDLARQMPGVDFIAVGEAQSRSRDAALRRDAVGIPNLHLTGFVDQFTSPLFSEILSTSWVLVNTSKLEGLPVSFLEAASYGCAILSRVDPDGFASRFGACAPTGDFEAGLRFLLERDRWRERGQRARHFVSQHHHLDRAVDAHVDLYQRLMQSSITEG